MYVNPKIKTLEKMMMCYDRHLKNWPDMLADFAKYIIKNSCDSRLYKPDLKSRVYKKLMDNASGIVYHLEFLFGHGTVEITAYMSTSGEQDKLIVKLYNLKNISHKVQASAPHSVIRLWEEDYANLLIPFKDRFLVIKDFADSVVSEIKAKDPLG